MHDQVSPFKETGESSFASANIHPYVDVDNVDKMVILPEHVMQFRPCTLWFFSPAIAWSRLQDFHRRSLDQTENFRQPVTHQLTLEQASAAYQTALLCILSQFASIPTFGRQRIFSRLLQHVSDTKSFDGLEAPFLTGLNAVGLAGDQQLFAEGLEIWKQIGPSTQFGSGLGAVPFLDVGTKTCTFLDGDAFARLGPHGPDLGILAPGPNLGAYIQSMSGMEVALTENQKGMCVGGAKIVGAVAGGIIGARVATASGVAVSVGSGGAAAPAAAVAGAGFVVATAGLGLAVGGAVGDVICGALTDTKDETADSGTSIPDAGTTSTSSGGVITTHEVVITDSNDTEGVVTTTSDAGTTSDSSGGVITTSDAGTTSGSHEEIGGGESGDHSGGESGDHSGGESGDHSGGESQDYEEEGEHGDMPGYWGGGPGSGGHMDKDLFASLLAGGSGLQSETYPVGPGIEAYVTQVGSHSFSLQNMPQLSLKGQTLRLSESGILAAHPGFSSQNAPQITLDKQWLQTDSTVSPVGPSGPDDQSSEIHIHSGISAHHGIDVASEVDVHHGIDTASGLDVHDLEIQKKQIDS